jgi:hypothetical protein
MQNAKCKKETEAIGKKCQMPTAKWHGEATDSLFRCPSVSILHFAFRMLHCHQASSVIFFSSSSSASACIGVVE